MHGAGWLEGGLLASYEKMVIDADVLNMVNSMLEPVTVDDATLAVEAIAEVGPGGHFFGSEHTQERYKTEHFHPMVSDWRNYESWDESGRQEAHQRAEKLAKLTSTKPGLITTKDPTKPIITADHLLIPTFSPKKIGDKAVVIKGATNAKVKALAIDIIEIE